MIAKRERDALLERVAMRQRASVIKENAYEKAVREAREEKKKKQAAVMKDIQQQIEERQKVKQAE